MTEKKPNIQLLQNDKVKYINNCIFWQIFVLNYLGKNLIINNRKSKS